MKKGCTKVGHIMYHTPFCGGKTPIYNMAFKYTKTFLVWFYDKHERTRQYLSYIDKDSI
jgi:hypothetical protein